MAPGSDLDLRGTPISEELLHELLDALRDATRTTLRVGRALFQDAQFSGEAHFHGAQFTGDAIFERAQFSDIAWFSNAQFFSNARFGAAQFSGNTWFRGAVFSAPATFNGVQFSKQAIFEATQFSDEAWFNTAQFSSYTTFTDAQFSDDAHFHGAEFSDFASFDKVRISGNAIFAETRFSGDTWFEDTHIAGEALFHRATFESTTLLGPLVCQNMLLLSEAHFYNPVTVEAATAYVVCQRTRWGATAALRLRYAYVDLTDAVTEYPLTVTARTTPFTFMIGESITEGELADTNAHVRMGSLSGTDAAHLVLHNVDLSACQFVGTLHLDQLRLEGQYSLAPAPTGWRWTKRHTLAEEQYWRAEQGQASWTSAPEGVEVAGPAALAPVYRQLRKSFEDSKNEPDAADFYYGEMEMRRHDPARPRAERALLAVYWAASGYGLRASRALAWLLLAMIATIVLILGVGLPDTPAKPYEKSAGVVGKAAPTLSGAFPDRFNGPRTEKAADVVINSVIFRSSGQDLTTAGTYIEMGSRLSEPVLLGLALLAVRGRVKR